MAQKDVVQKRIAMRVSAPQAALDQRLEVAGVAARRGMLGRVNAEHRVEQRI